MNLSRGGQEEDGDFEVLPTSFSYCTVENENGLLQEEYRMQTNDDVLGIIFPTASFLQLIRRWFNTTVPMTIVTENKTIDAHGINEHFSSSPTRKPHIFILPFMALHCNHRCNLHWRRGVGHGGAARPECPHRFGAI